jgi:FAD:protein FMN transferase
MGTDCEWIVDADDSSAAIAAFAQLEGDLARRETEWSRFLPDSSLSRLNRDGSVMGSAEMLDIVQQALQLREETEGLFDPTLHDAIVAAGYDRSFAEIDPRENDGVFTAVSGDGAVLVDAETGIIRLAPGARLDLGGIAKGYAADRAADVLCAVGPCVINLGGEVAVRGMWPVGVESSGEPLVVQVENATIATSGIDRRRWMRGDREHHHLIDPATAVSCATDLLRVSVVASDGARADALATALVVAGRDRAREMADRLGVVAILQTRDGIIDSRAVAA